MKTLIKLNLGFGDMGLRISHSLWGLLFLIDVNQELPTDGTLRYETAGDDKTVSVGRRAARSEPWCTQRYKVREKRKIQKETEKQLSGEGKKTEKL